MATPETKAKQALYKLTGNIMTDFGIKNVDGLDKLPDADLSDVSVWKYYRRRSNAAGGVGFSNGTADTTLTFTPAGCSFAVNIDVEVKAKYNTPTLLQLINLRRSFLSGNNAWVIWADRDYELAWFEKNLRALLRGEYVHTLKIERLRAPGKT